MEPLARCSLMQHKGINYTVVQTANPSGWRWTVELVLPLKKQDWHNRIERCGCTKGIGGHQQLAATAS